MADAITALNADLDAAGFALVDAEGGAVKGFYDRRAARRQAVLDRLKAEQAPVRRPGALDRIFRALIVSRRAFPWLR